MSSESKTVDWDEVLVYMSDKIPAVRAEFLKKHLKECEECREKLQEVGRERPQRMQSSGRANSLFRKYRVPFMLLGVLVVGGLLSIPALRRNEAAPSLHAQRFATVSSLSASMNHAPEPSEVEPKSVTSAVKEIAPMIARSVALSIVVKDCVAARVSLEGLLARRHGYVEELTMSAEQNNARSLQASLRIPAEELNVAIAELRSLGTVETETQQGEEVAQQHSDLMARLKNSRAMELRLRTIIEQRTGKMSDVLEVEREISRVRGEIEGMEAEQRALEHRVDFVTIDLRLGEEFHAQLGTPSLGNRFRNAIVSGFQSAADIVVSMVIFCMNYGPSAILWLAILFVPGRIIWKRSRRLVTKAEA